VFSSVTFIGYQISGLSGAVVSTIGIFFPSFVFVAFLNPLVKRIRSSALFAAFLDAVNAASVAIIIAVCFAMSRESIYDWRTIIIAVAGLAVMFGFRNVNSAWIVIGGSVAGYILSLL
jgi:chromate transporter